MCPGGSAYTAVICTVLIFCISLQFMEGKAYGDCDLSHSDVWSYSDELDLEVM